MVADPSPGPVHVNSATWVPLELPASPNGLAPSQVTSFTEISPNLMSSDPSLTAW